MSLYTILAMGIRFLEAGCDEHEVARAIANQINEEFPEEFESIRLVCRNTFQPTNEVNDGEIQFLSKIQPEEEAEMR